MFFCMFCFQVSLNSNCCFFSNAKFLSFACKVLSKLPFHCYFLHVAKFVSFVCKVFSKFPFCWYFLFNTKDVSFVHKAFSKLPSHCCFLCGTNFLLIFAIANHHHLLSFIMRSLK